MPENIDQVLSSAAMLEKQGDYNAALKRYMRAIRQSPQNAQLYFHAGRILGHRNLSVAQALFRRAIAFDPDLLCAYHSLSSCLATGQNTLDEAIEINLAAQKRFGPDEKLMVQYAYFLDRRGDTDEAVALARGIRNTDDKLTPASACLLVEMAHNTEEYLEALDSLESHTEAGLNSPGLWHAFFALGRLYDKLGRHDDAFTWITRANHLAREKYNGKAIQEKIERTISYFSSNTLNASAKSRVTTKSPIFIVGLPRCGSTLVEQILSAHPDIIALGESNHIEYAERKLRADLCSKQPYPGALTGITELQLTRVADDVLMNIKHTKKNIRRFTDKSLSNYLRIGLIELLFPNSRIIHMRRQPLDHCLACYFAPIKGISYKFKLEDLGHKFCNYRTLMRHWQSVSHLPILELDYEELVTDPRPSISRMLEFCELPWSESCMEPHKSKRLASTLSFNQVRRPLYTTSIGRWKHYEQYLDPLIDSLSPCYSREELVLAPR